MRRDKKNKRLLSLFILFIFMSSFCFGGLLYLYSPNVVGSVQDEDYSIESDFNVFENLPYMYSGTFYESTDYKYKFDNAKIQFQFEDFSYDEDYPVIDSLDNSESNRAYGEDNFTFTDGSGAGFDNMMAEDLVYSYFNFTGIGLYNATHSFTDELEGTSGDDIDFVDTISYSGTGTSVEIVGEFNNHNKVLNITDSSITEYITLENNFAITTDIIIEFWWAVSSIISSDGASFRIYEGGSEKVGLYINSDDLRTYNPAATAIKDNFIVANTWFHVRLILDDSADTFDCYIDGVLEGNDVAYRNVATTGVDSVQFGSGLNDLICIYVDAVDFSWDPSYEDGRNREENWVPIDYEATYSFESDAVGSVPSGWAEAATATVVPAFNKHNQVIEMVRDGSTAIISQTFTDGVQTSGTVEFWFGSDDVTHLSHARLYKGSSHVILVNLGSEKIQYYESGYHDITSATDNVMYHIRIDFECGAGAYEGLAADTFYIYIDGVKFGAYPFKAVSDEVDNLYFTLNSGAVYNAYVDAVGYDWDTGYEIGDNTIFTPSIIDNYPATYSFYKQPVWTSELDIDLIDTAIFPVGEIIEEKDGHKKVLRLQGNAAGDKWYNHLVPSHETEGVIEYWWSQTDATLNYNYVLLGTSTSHAFRIQMMSGDLIVSSNMEYGGGDIISGVVNEQWYHIKLEFYIDPTNGDANWIKVWVDDVYIGLFGSYGSPQYISTIYLCSTNQAEVFYDAIGFSWDENYNIGDNLNDNFYLGYENFEGYNKTEYGNYFGTYSFEDIYTEEGVHYSTYDFRDEVGEIGDDIIFVDVETITGGGGTLEIEENFQEHTHVLNATTNGAWANLRDTFNSTQTEGTVEFWFWVSADNSNTFVIGGDGANFLELQLTTTGELNYYRDVGGATTFDYYDTNTWNHIRIDFNVTSELFDIYLNGTAHNDLDCSRNVAQDYTNVDDFVFYDHVGGYFYLDAIGYSWDTVSHDGLGYEIGYNTNDYDLEPLLESYFNFNIHYGMNVSVEAYYDFHNFVLKMNDYYYSMTNYYEGVEDFDDYLVYTILGDYEGTESFDYTTLADYYYGTYDWRDLDTPAETFYGTYDFREYADGTSGTTIDFVDVYDGTAPVIEASLDGHKKILMQTDNNAYCYNSFSAKTSGEIEYWVRTTDATPRTNMYLYGTGRISFKITTEEFIYTNVVVGVTAWECLDDTWYHIRIVWRNDDTVDIYCNGVKEVDNDSMSLAGNDLTSFRLQTYDTQDSYLDAVGYSWDTTSHSGLGYTIDYNKISYDIEPILETGVSLDNIVIGDYCRVVNPFNNHNYALMINGSVSATTGSLSNREPPAQFGDFDFTPYGTGDSAGDLDDDDGDYATIGSDLITGGESSVYSDPTYDDFNSGWTTAPLWSKIDDGIRQPTTTGWTDGFITGDNPDYCYFDMSDVVIPANNYITKITVWAYRNTDDAEYNEYLEASYQFEGYTTWSTQISISGTGWAWDSATWSGLVGSLYGDTEADALQVRLDCEQFSADTTVWEVDALYAQIYYVPHTYDIDYTIEWDVADVDLVSMTKLYYEYKTTQSIAFQMQIWNYDTTTYTTLETETTTNWVSGSYTLTDPYINGTNYIKVRFHKTGGASATDMDQYIDYLYIDYSTLQIDNDARSFSVYDTFSVGTGIIEFWAYFYDSPYVNQIIFNNNTQIYLDEDANYCFYNGTETVIVHATISAWSHWKIDWTGNDVDIYINGTLELSIFWAGGAVTLDRIDFMSFEGEEFYVDAVGYDWDTTSHDGLGYTVGWDTNPYDIIPLFDFIDSSNFGLSYNATMSVVPYLDGHINVLNSTNAHSDNVKPVFRNTFSSPQSTGTVEFWARFSDGMITYINLGGNKFQLIITGNAISYHDGGAGQPVCPITPDTWYHIKLVFDCNSGVDSFADIYVNGTLEVDDAEFKTDVATVDIFYVYSYPGASGTIKSAYFDAIGYSWDAGYNVNDNCNPYGVLTDMDDNWDITYAPYTAINILDELDFHYQVLNMTTWTPDVYEYVKYSFTEQLYGTIDFWVKSDECDYNIPLYLYDGGSAESVFYINDNKFQYYDGVLKDIPNVGIPQDDTWHHITIHFCTDASGYANLAEDQIRFVIDGIDSGVLDMIGVSGAIDSIVIQTSNDNGGNEHSVYFDAFDFSWDASYIHPAHNEIPFGGSSGNNFTVSSDETIEMWISGNFSNYFRTYFYESGAVVFAIKFDEDYFYYTDMGVWTKDTWVVSDWTHLKIYFEASTNTYDIWINGTSIASNIDSHIAFTTIDEWTYETEYYVNSTFYIDAIGYSWESDYDIGDNINSYGKEVITELEAEGWTITNNVFVDVGISGEFNFHKKFLNVSDNSVTGNLNYFNAFSSGQTTGTIEFWIKSSDVTKAIEVDILNDLSQISIDINIDSSKFQYYIAGWNDVGLAAVNDVWYHVRLVFDCTTDTYEIWINGIQYQSAVDFRNVATTLDQFGMRTGDADSGFNIFFDAIHYSWEDTNTYFKGEHNEHCDIEAVIDFVVEIPFDDYDKKILWIDIESVHFTSTLTNVSFNYYNHTSEWYELNNTVNTSPTSHNPIYSGNTLTGFFDGSGIQLKYYMYNHSSFWFANDLINVTIWYKTELNYEHTLEWIGSWRYRFLLDDGLASSWNSSWIIFDVVAQPPNFEGISESRYSTRWILTSTATTGTLGLVYSDELTSGYWDLSDYSSRYFTNTELINIDAYVYSALPATNYGTDVELKVAKSSWTENRRTYLAYQGTPSYFIDNRTGASNTKIYLYATVSNDYPYIYDTTIFDESTLNWNNKPAHILPLLSQSATGTGWKSFSLGSTTTSGYWTIKPGGISATTSVTYRSSDYAGINYDPYMQFSYCKNYHITTGEGYMYIQTDNTETLGLISPQLASDVSLNIGDIFTVDLETTSSNALLKLYNDNVLQSTFNLLIANTETARQEVEVYVSEDVVYDQVKITSGLDDTEYFKLFDIKAEHWTFVAGEEQDSMFVEPFGQNELIIDTLGNSSLKIYENDVIVADTYVDISYDLLTYVYESPIAENVFVTFYDSNNDYLDFNDFTTYVNYTLYGEDYGDERLTNREFYADEFTNIYFDIYDSFNVSVFSESRQVATLIDITLPVYELKIKNEALELVTYSLQNNLTAITKTGNIFPEEIVEFSIATGNYSLDYTNYEDMYPREYNFELTDHTTITINTTYHTVYIGLFTYDGLGLNRDWVRLYINDVRADFGFNVIQSETANLTVLDYFNNTLASEIIDASAWSEYNLYAQVYSMYILNQFTYNDLIVNITQVDSGMWMNQLIPSASALLYRFIPNINYTINATYVNGTVYSIRTINLTDNSQIESFGVPSAPSEYPKDVFFGVYTTTGLGIDHDLLRFYVDNNRTDFGFNRITDEITNITVKDFFNTTMFTKLVNFSCIYEYDILITLHSLKVKNEARISANYTLSYGVLETTGYILPEEIIEYQLSSNNYVFDYTNNEDNSFHTININLNRDRVYILNSTYYNIYFSLCDLNLHIIDSNQYVFRLNGTREVFGFIYDLTTDDYTITVVDRFGTSLFNDVVTLRGLNEYVVNITLYELQISHLARVNGNLTLSETTGHSSLDFNMSPDSLKSFILGSSTYNITWLNNENSITTTYDINLIEDYILTLNTSYYDIYFSLFDLNLHTINPDLYEFRLNGTLQDLGLIVDLQTDDYTITIIDRFENSLFNSIVTLRGLNEYRINITLYELQIRHLATENSNLTLYETTTHNYLNFSMAPDTIRSFILGSSTYNITWINGENRLSVFYDINLNLDYILTLNTTFYNIYFSLYDQNGVRLDDSLFSLYINTTRKDFGFVRLESNDTLIVVQDYLNVTVFNRVVGLSDYAEYNIIITVYELQIRHLAFENSNLTLYETTTHNYLNFSMAPDTIRSFILSDSTYNITWTNGENSVSTLYNITLNENYILLLDTTYYSVYIGLYNFYDVVSADEVKFYINGTRADFGFNTIKSEYVNLVVLDYFNSTLYSQVVRLEGLNEYSVFIQAYTLIINNLYNEQTITIKMTRGTITVERLIESQGWIEFKLFANATYEIISYINGTEDEEKDIELDEEYKVVDFGFYETEVPIIPLPQVVEAFVQWAMIILFFMIFVVIAVVVYYRIKMEEIKKKNKNPNSYVPPLKLQKTPYY